MKVISLIGQKGGSGKTMTSENIAVMATQAGLKTLLVDFDPQTTAAKWGDRRTDNGMPEDAPAVLSAQAARIPQILKAAQAQGADLVVLDTPPKSAAVSTDAARVSDLVLVPMRPFINDLETADALQDILTVAGNPRTFVFFNSAPSKGRRHLSAADYMRTRGFQICPIALGDRVDFSDAPIDGMAACEHDPASFATSEFREFYEFILDIVNSRTPKHEITGTCKLLTRQDLTKELSHVSS